MIKDKTFGSALLDEKFSSCLSRISGKAKKSFCTKPVSFKVSVAYFLDDLTLGSTNVSDTICNSSLCNCVI